MKTRLLKTLTMVVFVCLTLTVFGALTAAEVQATAVETLLLSEDFNDYNVGMFNGQAHPFTLSSNGRDTFKIADNPDSSRGGKAVYFERYNKNKAEMHFRTGDIETGEGQGLLAIEYDLWIPKSGNGVDTFMLQLFNGIGNNKGLDERVTFVAFRDDPSGGALAAYHPNATTGKASVGQNFFTGYQLKNWYSIKQVVNLEKKEYDIYVDNSLMEEGIPFATLEDDTIRQISFMGAAITEDYPDLFYMDNIKIYRSNLSIKGPKFEEISSPNILIEDFDDYNVGMFNGQAHPFTLSSNGRDTFKIAENPDPSRGGKAVYFERYNRNKAEMHFRTGDIETGEGQGLLAIEYDLWIPKSGNGIDTFMHQIFNGTGNNKGADERISLIAFRDDTSGGALSVYQPDDTNGQATVSEVFFTGYQLNNWYTIKQVIDLEKKEYDVYLDNSLMVEGVPLATLADDTIRQISFMGSVESEDYSDLFYMDNIKIYRPSAGYSIKVSVEAENYLTSALPSTIIVGLFNSHNTLKDIMAESKVLEPNTPETVSTVINIPIEEYKQGTSIRVFIWDSLEGMRPLSGAARLLIE